VARNLHRGAAVSRPPATTRTTARSPARRRGRPGPTAPCAGSGRSTRSIRRGTRRKRTTTSSSTTGA
jgi:hypothetical protein